MTHMTYTVINIDALSSPVHCVTHPSVRNWSQHDKSVFVYIVLGVETIVNESSLSCLLLLRLAYFFFSSFSYRGPFILSLLSQFTSGLDWPMSVGSFHASFAQLGVFSDGFLLSFDPEDGNDMYLRNVGSLPN
jgi:hypothetical protein